MACRVNKRRGTGGLFGNHIAFSATMCLLADKQPPEVHALLEPV